MEKSLRDFGSSFIAGGVSGSIVKTLTAPVERVKLILQTQVPCITRMLCNVIVRDHIRMMTMIQGCDSLK
jgi:hypothetical protein